MPIKTITHTIPPHYEYVATEYVNGDERTKCMPTGKDTDTLQTIMKRVKKAALGHAKRLVGSNIPFQLSIGSRSATIRYTDTDGSKHKIFMRAKFSPKYVYTTEKWVD